MTKKRFIKLMRAAHYPRHLINKAVNTVKLRGGSMSHKEYMLKFNLCALITGAPAESIISKMEKKAEFYARLHATPKIKPLARSSRHYGKRAQFTIIDDWTLIPIDTEDDPDETKREMWSKENPHINGAGKTEVKA